MSPYLDPALDGQRYYDPAMFGLVPTINNNTTPSTTNDLPPAPTHQAPGPSPPPPNTNPFLQVHPGAYTHSDSSSSSSPDIASFLPIRNRWDSPMPPPAPSSAPSLQQPSSNGSPIRASGTTSAPPWYGVTGPAAGYEQLPDLGEWRDDRYAAPLPVSDASDYRHPYMAPAHPYPPPPRHHPYLATEQRPLEPPRKSGRLGVKRRQKYTRSRTGCLGCRARRIKCDEARPICRRCVVAKRESDCVFPDQCDKKRKGSDSEYSSPEHGRKPLSPDETVPGLIHRVSDESQPTISSLSTHRGSGSGQSGTGIGTGLGEMSLKPSPGEPFGTLGFDLMPPEGFGLPWSAPPFLDGAPMTFLDHSNAPVPHHHQPHPPHPSHTHSHSHSHSHSHPSNMDAIGNPASSNPHAQDQAQVARDPNGEKKPRTPQTQMLTAPNFLLPWFPTMQEQNLILHFCAHATALTIAIPRGPNPMLVVFLQLALASTRGTSVACDALRLTLPGVGAAHQAFLQSRGSNNNDVGPNAAASGAFAAALALRDEGKDLVRAAAVRGDVSDAALAAASSLATIDIFLGGTGWKPNFALAKRLVAACGGPRALIAGPTTALPDGSSVTPARLSLEILAIYDTFGALVSGDEPTLVHWWFDDAISGTGKYAAHSVETQFGVSRAVVHLFARVVRILARVTHVLSEPLTPSSPALGGRRQLSADVFGVFVGRHLDVEARPEGRVHIARDANPFSATSNEAGAGSTNCLAEDAACLKLDVDGWIESLSTPSDAHEHVHAGDRAYSYAMRILLLRMVFGRARTDTLVQRAALEVMQHCSISTAAMGMSIDLMWPTAVAGCCLGGGNRAWVETLLEGFKAQCCFDVDTASRIIREVWRRVDGGDVGADWRRVCEELGLKVLLC